MTTTYTIGHSTHTIDTLLSLLAQHQITAVADVRSSPHSRLNPQFNRNALAQALKQVGVSYVFVGKELGARSENPACYLDGKVQYDLLAKTELFRAGLERVIRGSQDHRVVLLCAEKDPIACHRAILIARKLRDGGVDVQHILANGDLESHEQLIERLLAEMDLAKPDLFRPRNEAIEEAYRRRADQIAFALPNESTEIDSP